MIKGSSLSNALYAIYHLFIMAQEAPNRKAFSEKTKKVTGCSRIIHSFPAFGGLSIHRHS